jgi:TctA family transporter
MMVMRFEAAPLLLGFVLGPLMEENLRRALLISRGQMSTFVDRPISATLLALSLALVLWSFFAAFRRSVKARVQAE